MKNKFPKLSRKPWDILVLSLLVLLSHSSLVAQTENTIINPRYFDDFIGYQFLPGEGVRIVTRSDQNNAYGDPGCAVTDFYPGQPLQSLEPKFIRVDSQYINYNITELYMVPMRHGSTLLANNQFDCDFWPPGGYINIDSLKRITWFVDLYEHWDFPETGIPLFIDSNTLLINPIMYGADHLITLDGTLLPLVDSVERYDTILQSSFGFVGSKADQLVLLNTAFDTITSFTLFAPIEMLQSINHWEYIITTSDKFYLLDTNQLLHELLISRNVFYLVWKSDDYYWALGHQLIKMDTQFEQVDTLQLPPGITLPMTGFSLGNDMVMISQYLTNIMHGIVIWRGNEETFEPALPQDIGVTQIALGDTITAIYHSAPWHYGYDHYFPSIQAEVRNFGQDTILRFSLHLNLESYCDSYCSNHESIWDIDSLKLAPQESAWIDLGYFSSECYPNATVNFCLSTLAPNELADGNYLNDMQCETITPLLVGNKDPKAEQSMSVIPNPATDVMRIVNAHPDLKDGTIEIFNFTGQIVKNITSNDINQSIDISSLLPGPYIVSMTNSLGYRASTKLIIQ